MKVVVIVADRAHPSLLRAALDPSAHPIDARLIQTPSSARHIGRIAVSRRRAIDREKQHAGLRIARDHTLSARTRPRGGSHQRVVRTLLRAGVQTAVAASVATVAARLDEGVNLVEGWRLVRATFACTAAASGSGATGTTRLSAGAALSTGAASSARLALSAATGPATARCVAAPAGTASSAATARSTRLAAGSWRTGRSRSASTARHARRSARGCIRHAAAGCATGRDAACPSEISGRRPCCPTAGARARSS